jgi:hypothetical protein
MFNLTSWFFEFEIDQCLLSRALFVCFVMQSFKNWYNEMELLEAEQKARRKVKKKYENAN